jgi:hypothetical protein
MSRVFAKLLSRAGLVSLAEPSLFTPERVAYITGMGGCTDTTQRPSVMSTFTFGRHFAASVDTRMVLAVVDSRSDADSEWEFHEGILGLVNIINHLSSSSPSATPDDRLATRATEMLLKLTIDGRDAISTDLWCTVSQALRLTLPTNNK